MNGRRGLSKTVAALFCAITVLALIAEIIFVGETIPLVLHTMLAALGVAAVVIAWRSVEPD